MKRIVCGLDGTWNDNSGDIPLTNVAKLIPLVAPMDKAGVRQVAGYFAGIASSRSETAKFLKGAIGYGVEDRIEQAYKWLVEVYEPGDEIHLVGFSRGAFAARSLAGFLHLVGLAKPGSETWFAQAWAKYRLPARRRRPAFLERLRANAHYPVAIASLAVWDTVGNLANPFVSGGPLSRRRFGFHDLSLNASTSVALHALALDEVRGPFRPTLFSLPQDASLAPHQHVEQVWFAGTHADVGGGYAETALSDIALVWMVERLEATTGLVFDRRRLADLVKPDPLGPQHSGTTSGLFKLSALLPYVRLVRQDPFAVKPLRRAILGAFRTGRLASGLNSLHEQIHHSAVERFGREVDVLADSHRNSVIYRPRNLEVALAGHGSRLSTCDAARD